LKFKKLVYNAVALAALTSVANADIVRIEGGTGLSIKKLGRKLLHSWRR